MEERLLSIVWMRDDAQGRGNLKHSQSTSVFWTREEMVMEGEEGKWERRLSRETLGQGSVDSRIKALQQVWKRHSEHQGWRHTHTACSLGSAFLSPHLRFSVWGWQLEGAFWWGSSCLWKLKVNEGDSPNCYFVSLWLFPRLFVGQK